MGSPVGDQPADHTLTLDPSFVPPARRARTLIARVERGPQGNGRNAASTPTRCPASIALAISSVAG
jgi:hypothetical protein